MGDIHIWNANSVNHRLQIKSTQPNVIKLNVSMILQSQTQILVPKIGPDGIFQFDISADKMAKLMSGTPNYDGTYLDINVISILHPGNVGKRWGWTYRLSASDGSADSAVDLAGNAVNRDANGWVRWDRVAIDFGEQNTVIDGIPLDFRS